MHSILAVLGVIHTQVGFFPDINQKRQRDWGWMPVLENAPFTVRVAGWRSTDWIGGQLPPIHGPRAGFQSPSGTGAQGSAAEQDAGHGMQGAGCGSAFLLQPHTTASTTE